MSDDPILAALARLEAGQARLEAGQSRLEAELANVRTGFLEELGSTRAAIMERLERMREDVGVSFGRADAVQRVAENTREELRGLSEILSTMIKRVRAQDERIERLQAEVAELKGRP